MIGLIIRKALLSCREREAGAIRAEGQHGRKRLPRPEPHRSLQAVRLIMPLAMMRRFTVVFGVLLSAALFFSAEPQATAARFAFRPEQEAALDKVSVYLNSIHSLKSGFIQLGPDGQLDQGEFLLQKPGQMRFEYDPPSATLVVATGGAVYVKNSRLNTVDRYSLSDTPLGLLLNDNVDLKTNSAVTGIDIRDDSLVVHARTSNNRQQGNITLVFSSPQIELRQWTVKDNQGGTTMVALHNPAIGVPLDATLFTPPAKTPSVKR
jgi:outer membrane lipoprotein-sorting protein